MPHRLLRHTIALLFLIIAMTDFMVPCCAFAADEDETVSITSSGGKTQIQAPAESKDSRTHKGACDQCYCCSHFIPAGTVSLPKVEALALVAPDLLPPQPYAEPVRIYRPPRA